MPTSVRLIDSRDIRPIDVRARPAGYLVLRGAEAVAERLGLNEVSVRDRAPKKGQRRPLDEVIRWEHW